jgi:hypothetical protein
MKNIYIVMIKEECENFTNIESCKAFESKKQAREFMKTLKPLFDEGETSFYIEICPFEFEEVKCI